ncbi:putative cysteine-rich receptor-like protein kinase 20 [Olea europaea var. sylvestris]|uniref:putative cysteine-rich receptor-like protein kinase 20 n=1 Tax=Olea europaea var. sylvestris TaxID=158386 RepID=UPI000C1CDA1D|nr:putative cysteine-rich receptor-like protein kinase 20 [Olea europaea var. sylvestris]
MNLQQLPENDGSGRTIYVRLAASAPQFSSNKKNKGVVIGVVVGSAAVVTMLLAIVKVTIRRRQRHILGTANAVERSSLSYLELELGEDNKNDTGVPFYSWKSILASTENFSDVHKLGQGGFGPVYKVLLPGGKEIAVKRLSSFSVQGSNEFQNEVVLIAKLQRRNLVQLLGYCIEGNEKILLYEYMPNKSLDVFIFGI